MQFPDNLTVIEIKSFLTSSALAFATHNVKVFLDGKYVNVLQDGGTVQLEVEPGQHQVEVRDPVFGINKSEVLTVDAVGSEQIDLRVTFNKKCGNVVLIQLLVIWVLTHFQNAAAIGIYFSFAIVAIIFVDLILISKRGTAYVLRAREDFRGF